MNSKQTQRVWIAIALAILTCIAALPLFALLLPSCSPKPPPVCEALSTRCDGQKVQVCDPQGQWSTTMDCSTVDPGDWVCTSSDQGSHTCLQADEK